MNRQETIVVRSLGVSGANTVEVLLRNSLSPTLARTLYIASFLHNHPNLVPPSTSIHINPT